MNRNNTRLLLSSHVAAITLTAAGQPLCSAQIDSLATRCLKIFNVPGIALGL